MELYFDRPRLREGRPTFLDSSRKDWMWFHDHDWDLDVDLNGILYLYRDPVDTIFSLLNHQINSSRNKWFFGNRKKVYQNFKQHEIDNLCRTYRLNIDKWLAPGRAKTILSYEKFTKNYTAEFSQICAHFDQPLDEERCKKAFLTVTKESLIKITGDTPGAGSHMLKEDYAKQRSCFQEQWSEHILKACIPKNKESFFTN
jgi:hypothetical protein